MRVFIAVDLSKEAKKEISKLLKTLKKKHWPVKWEKPEKLHQTLAFLGSLTIDQVSQVYQVCQKSARGIKPFSISFKGLGAFPSYDFVRIIWLGLKGDLKDLARLEKNIKREIMAVFENTANKKNINFLLSRPFSPHITLGRVEKKTRLRQRTEIGRQIKGLRILEFKSEVLVNQIVIYQSIFKQGSTVYQPLLVIPLKSS